MTYTKKSIKIRKPNFWSLKNLWIENDGILVSALKPRKGDMHHFESPPMNSKIRKKESYSRIPHDHRNSLQWPKKWFLMFVIGKTTVRSVNSLDCWYCRTYFWKKIKRSKIQIFPLYFWVYSLVNVQVQFWEGRFELKGMAPSWCILVNWVTGVTTSHRSWKITCDQILWNVF